MVGASGALGRGMHCTRETYLSHGYGLGNLQVEDVVALAEREGDSDANVGVSGPRTDRGRKRES